MLGVIAMILAVIAVVVIVSFIASKATEDETDDTYSPGTDTENTYDPDGGYYPYHRPVYRPRYGNDGGGYRPRSVYGGGGGGIGK